MEIIRNQTRDKILEYLRDLGKDSTIYSAMRKGLSPLFPQSDMYVYATEREIVFVLIDQGTGTRTDNVDNVVWDMVFTCELFRNRLLRLSKNIPAIIGVVITADYVIDYNKKNHLWETLNVNVYHQVKGLERLNLPINSDQELPIAFPLMFLFEAEYSETDVLYASHHLQSLF